MQKHNLKNLFKSFAAFVIVAFFFLFSVPASTPDSQSEKDTKKTVKQNRKPAASTQVTKEKETAPKPTPPSLSV